MDVVTYALARKFTEETAIQFGAVRGANCQIVSIVPSPDGTKNTVTFQWKNDDDQIRTSQMEVLNGEKGVSIEEVSINSSNHLIVTFSDGSIVDAGSIIPVAKLTESITATENIGSVTSGKTYAVGTSLEQIIKDMLIKYQPPVVTLSITPSETLYDVVTEEITTIRLTANVTKKTKNVSKIEFYVNNELVNTVTSGVVSGGQFVYDYTAPTPIKSDSSFKAIAYDLENKTGSSTISVKFVANTYYGICDPSVSDTDETTIKSGSKILKDTRTYTYSGITTNWGKIFYAYPKSFGALTYIKDEVNNINYFDSFQRSEETVDNIDYYCYTLIDPTAAENNQITFK